MPIDRPKSPEHAVYIYLSWLQEQLVAALAPTESEPDGG